MVLMKSHLGMAYAVRGGASPGRRVSSSHPRPVTFARAPGVCVARAPSLSPPIIFPRGDATDLMRCQWQRACKLSAERQVFTRRGRLAREKKEAPTGARCCAGRLCLCDVAHTPRVHEAPPTHVSHKRALVCTRAESERAAVARSRGGREKKGAVSPHPRVGDVGALGDAARERWRQR